MRDNQGLSEIIVSNCFSPFFAQSVCTLIHGRTTIHQKAAVLFNIHACILMGYFNNNNRDNNEFLCNIPVKKKKKMIEMIQTLSGKGPATDRLSPPFPHI